MEESFVGLVFLMPAAPNSTGIGTIPGSKEKFGHMTQSWLEIWNRRVADGPVDLAQLVRLDGFDTGAGRIEAQDWQAYCEIIGRKLGVRNGHSVFEVGCGAGAFLFALRKIWVLEIGGLDYSKSLIGVAREALPDGQFQLSDARGVSVEPQYDFVISNSVFHYLSDDAGSVVLDKMISKARIATAILEVPDASTKAESESLRRGVLGPKEYDEKNRGLEHTYYTRAWFMQRAQTLGLSAEIFDGCVPNYAQNQFRFGVIIRKPSPDMRN
jgi:SAM-dependent methyltransferase